MVTVFFELNGQPREVNVLDRKLEGNLHKQPKADPDNPAHIAAPMPGKVSSVAVKKGQSVKEGERLLSFRPELRDERGPDGMLNIDAIADAYWTLHHQHRSAWTLELDLRPWAETF